ncbi:carbohydrate kinase family protein [Polaribacter atrinae]|uniref:Carbohydrate kinase n=1 Tax=Polaribacter atrinae TaxID=1333662 RepID=A0A176TGW8_9FLAO|nr:carbohydrate kinase [Polaribacter atrinae]OAD46626.1 carbohydrate kinase [Polaribacter atrinae]
MSKVVCFGEVLWDIFPTHKKIGGAPLNVASRLSSFGHNVTMISALGEDNFGQKIIEYLKDNKVNTNHIQIKKQFQTGKVNVILDKRGTASYTINYPSAWDKISITEKAKNEVENADAFVFGSLIARDKTSRKTLYELIEAAKYKIFDLNLRQSHYTTDVLLYLMEKANFIKFNDDELYEVCKKIGSKYNSLEQNIRFIAAKTNTNHVCVTKGPHGAVLLYNDIFYYNSGYQINVIDTVGAGDSFLASLTSELLKKSTPQKAINFACAIGALVAQSEGANPKILQSEIETFINPQ